MDWGGGYHDMSYNLLFLYSSSPDSVHNDGERHIPYIMIFQNSTISKVKAWGKSQLSNGMIQEALRPGCFPGIPLSPKVQHSSCSAADIFCLLMFSTDWIMIKSVRTLDINRQNNPSTRIIMVLSIVFLFSAHLL